MPVPGGENMSSADNGAAEKVATWSDLADREPVHTRVKGVDLVVIRYDEEVSVLYGRCLHRGVLLGDGYVEGDNLICGVHGWDYRIDTGISEYDNSEVLETFTAWREEGAVYVDADEVAAWTDDNPQPYDDPESGDGGDGAMQGATDDIEGGAVDPEFYGDPDHEKEPYSHYIQSLAQEGPEGIGEHGDVSAMGVPRTELPSWEDLQILTAQLARTPLDDEAPIDTELVIGPNAENPLHLDIPIFVSDMSFGALSEEAKIAISKGADQAGTGVCSGEGGMLPEEREANSRYFYEYATGKFGWDIDLVEDV
jgi:glutamate synthase domain-containing protein 2